MSEAVFQHVFLGADHAGFVLKQAIVAHLQQQGVAVTDLGPFTPDSVDYPDYAQKVAQAVLAQPNSAGILVCGSGVGVSIGANRFNGIRAALCFDATIAKLCREHNNANVLCLGARMTAEPLALEFVDIFMTTETDPRHQPRIEKLDTVCCV